MAMLCLAGIEMVVWFAGVLNVEVRCKLAMVLPWLATSHMRRDRANAACLPRVQRILLVIEPRSLLALFCALLTTS